MKSIKTTQERARERSLAWYYANHEVNKKKVREDIKRFRRENPEKYLLISARNRAKTKGWDFNLDKEDIVIPALCPILKVPLIRNTRHSASLDRIDPTRGYVKGNVQVISRKANVMKNDATREELQEFYNWLKQYLHS